MGQEYQGFISSKVEKYQDAIECYNNSITIKPSYSAPNINREIAYQALKGNNLPIPQTSPIPIPAVNFGWVQTENGTMLQCKGGNAQGGFGIGSSFIGSTGIGSS